LLTQFSDELDGISTTCRTYAVGAICLSYGMGNAKRCKDLDYIQFLIASERYSSTEAAKVQPRRANAPAHDAFSRFLSREVIDTEGLWQEAEGCVVKEAGVLIADDTTLDKPYARQMDMVSFHNLSQRGWAIKT
jgi:hypothetical protein